MTASETTWVPPSVLERMTEELTALSAQLAPTPETSKRIRALREALRTTDAADKPNDGLVEPGMLVSVLFTNAARTSTFLLGSRELISLEPSIAVDVYSPSSPLGQALNGARVGDTVSFTPPSGIETKVRVISVEPFSG
ncbi:GreA/GreB family elongation factor [Pseudoclavibacter helvolus]|uniref:GreA/GreB family elongation factor n=1 Tax=Pseudoclavibacter helvolus TaxID=255205 RepID=UPI000ABA50B2|nr:GreA/GreB family elongation factor [Pseudoclavibacter helvolus]